MKPRQDFNTAFDRQADLNNGFRTILEFYIAHPKPAIDSVFRDDERLARSSGDINTGGVAECRRFKQPLKILQKRRIGLRERRDCQDFRVKAGFVTPT